MRLLGNLGVGALVVCVLGLSGCAGAESDELGTSQAKLIRTDHCSIRGSGSLPGGDVADADVLGDIGVTGSLTHVASDGSLLEGAPDFIFCRRDGSVIGDFSGPAAFRGMSGAHFTAHIQDRGERRPPTLVEGAATMMELSVTRGPHGRDGADSALAISGAARVRLPDALTVSRRGLEHATASLIFSEYGSLGEVTCDYRGAHGRHARHAAVSFAFAGCTASDGTAVELSPGDRVDVAALRLSLGTVARRCGRAAPLSVSAVLEVSPLTIIEALPDYYSIFVLSSADEVVYSADGNLAAGDFTVQLIEE